MPGLAAPIKVSEVTDPEVASDRAWFRAHQFIRAWGTEYIKFGGVRPFFRPRTPPVDSLQVTRAGRYDGVPLYIAAGEMYATQPRVLYVPADSMCGFQPYIRRQDVHAH